MDHADSVHTSAFFFLTSVGAVLARVYAAPASCQNKDGGELSLRLTGAFWLLRHPSKACFNVCGAKKNSRGGKVFT